MSPPSGQEAGGFHIKVHIAKCILGVFAFDENRELVGNRPFEGGPRDMALEFSKDDAEEALAREMKSRGHEVVCASVIPGFEHDPDNLARRALNEDMFAIAVKAGVRGTEEEAQQLVRDIGIQMANLDLARDPVGKELQAAQAVRALDDLDMVIDRLGQRLREWFLALYPHYTAELPDPEDFADIMASRYPWTTSTFHQKSLERIRGLLDMRADSIDPRELHKKVEAPDPENVLGRLAIHQSDLFDERRYLEGFITRTMEEAAPSLSKVAGPVLAARLVAEAGSLERLAKMASSTVQLLGAKRAVFRHVRSGDPPPKHGLLFIHPSVSGAKWWQRGRMAKALAVFVARAARSDAIAGTDIGDALKKELDIKLEKVRRKWSRAPDKEGPTPVHAQRPRGPQGRGGGGRGRGRGKGRGRDRGYRIGKGGNRRRGGR